MPLKNLKKDKPMHIKVFSISSLVFILLLSCNSKNKMAIVTKKLPKPNVLIILTDQWRAQATGYAGDPNVKTPHLDKLASNSVNFKNAVSGMPVCSPFRASLLTGQRPLTHGVFMNDVQLDTSAVTMGKVFVKAGYDTGYIGKWHLDGHGRLQFIPPGERRQGFQYWKGNECTHNYNKSVYYDNNDSIQKQWKGYDAFAQTDEAIHFIKDRKKSDKPFMLVLSYGTPHAPYHTAPEVYKKKYNTDKILLRDNVPDAMKIRVKKDLAGYYAHITALDDMIAKLISNLKKTGQWKNTIVVFTSDHGDLLGSHKAYKKQQPYDESIRVPMLYHLPKQLGIKSGERTAVMNSEDIMPTILGLCNIAIPETVEGLNYRPYLEGKEIIGKAAIITCVQPFGQWNRKAHGGREYRGIRTADHTYTCDLNGPWLLFDNKKDPYQLNNLIDIPTYAKLQNRLDELLMQKLKATGDAFLPGPSYIETWNYPIDKSGTVPYTH
jgi:arylsulfatase A-like enzyme